MSNKNKELTIGGVGDGEFLGVGLVMHIPTKDDRTEAETRLEDGEEFGLDHDFPAEDAVQIDAGDFDAVVVLEQFCELFEL